MSTPKEGESKSKSDFEYFDPITSAQRQEKLGGQPWEQPPKEPKSPIETEDSKTDPQG